MMLLASGDPILFIGALFVLGLVGLLLTIIMYGVKLFVWLGRVLAGPPGYKQVPSDQPAVSDEPNQAFCPRPNCGHINRSKARYCAVCGLALDQYTAVNAYG